MKDQSEPQPPSDDSNGEETVCIPPLFMALLHPEATLILFSSRHSGRCGSRRLIRQSWKKVGPKDWLKSAPKKRGGLSNVSARGDSEFPTLKSTPRSTL